MRSAPAARHPRRPPRCAPRTGCLVPDRRGRASDGCPRTGPPNSPRSREVTVPEMGYAMTVPCPPGVVGLPQWGGQPCIAQVDTIAGAERLEQLGDGRLVRPSTGSFFSSDGPYTRRIPPVALTGSGPLRSLPRSGYSCVRGPGTRPLVRGRARPSRCWPTGGYIATAVGQGEREVLSQVAFHGDDVDDLEPGTVYTKDTDPEGQELIRRCAKDFTTDVCSRG